MVNPVGAKTRTQAKNTSGLPELKNQLIVVLAAAGNPDHNQDPDKPMFGTAPQALAVGTLVEAAKVCREYIEENNLGGGNWAGGQIYFRGKGIAHASYNGRIWQGETLSGAPSEWVEVRPDAKPEDVLRGDRAKFEMIREPAPKPVEPSNWTNLVRREAWAAQGGDESRVRQYQQEYAQFKQAVIEEMHDHLFCARAVLWVDSQEAVVVTPVKVGFPRSSEEGTQIPRVKTLETDDFANGWAVFNGKDRSDDTVLAVYPCPMEAAAAAHRLTYWFDVQAEAIGQQAHMALTLCRLVGHAESQPAPSRLNEGYVRDVLDAVQTQIPRLQTVLSADIINHDETGPRR